MFLGKLMIAAATVASFYAFITFYPQAYASIGEPIVMLIVTFFIILDCRIDSICSFNGLYGRL